MRVLLPLVAILPAVALSAQSPLTTTFAGGSGQSGNMFDIQALNPAGITVNYFEANLATGTWDVEVWVKTVQGPYAPDVNNMAAWTLRGSATGIVSNGNGVPTLLPIPVCEYIPPTATQAFYVTVTIANVLGVNYTNSSALIPPVPTGGVFASNADLNFLAGAGLSYPFTGNFNPRVWNGLIYYSVGTPAAGCSTPTFASKSNYGAACYDAPRMVHEYWGSPNNPTPNAPVDLANTSWILTFSSNAFGGNYTISPGAPAYDSATAFTNGTNLVAGAYTTSSSGNWDDASINMTLPAAFGAGFEHPNAAGAVATGISVNSNGRIYLGTHSDNSFDSNGANSLFTPTSFQGTTGVGFPVIAALMNDLDPTVPGASNPSYPQPTGVYYEDPSPNGGVRITWHAVANWQDTAAGAPLAITNYLQMELLPGGIVFLSYGPSVGNGGSSDNEAIVGYSPGAGEPNSPVIDWSMITSLTTGSGPGVTIGANLRPVIGTTINVTAGNLPTGTLVGGIIYGVTPIPPGFPLLGVVGVPCNLYTSLDLLVTGILPGASFTTPFPFPNNPTLVGAPLGAQGFALNVNIPNPLGAAMSGGLLLTIGN